VVDANTVELIYCRVNQVFGQSFTPSAAGASAGLIRTRTEFEYDTNTNGGLNLSTAMSTVPGEAAYVVAWQGTPQATNTYGIQLDYYVRNDQAGPTAYVHTSLGCITR
jgi:hypothetical protein